MTSCASILAIFKSTLPRRERRFRQSERQVLINFYPRSREGSDKGKSKTKVPMNISIHAPAKGATSFISDSALFI